MVLPNPIYIDAEALHPASAVRLLAFAALEGQEGVIENTDLRVLAKTAPTAAIDVMPGAYVVRAKHTGGEKESYAGKVIEAEEVSVNPTSSGAGRTDLVILRIENPYVAGAGSWAQPTDPENGPYAHIRVIEGVPANTQSVVAHNNTWSAITLARIYRGPNRTTVEQADIVDLRQLASLENERIVIINNPPPEPPPIAYPIWSESTPIGNNSEHLSSQTGWHDFPSGISWPVPVPSWAEGVDIHVLLNPAVRIGWCKGETRLVFTGDTSLNSIPCDWNFNFPGDRIIGTIMVGGTELLSPGIRGKTVNVKIQCRSTDSGQSGKLVCEPGTRLSMLLYFKRNPVITDGF